ncbi:hypothetical protein F383_29291 [Gossypium arboreum]|uniref:Uncharacterized protein n=1 Tax=Gossypium arboreum TaxID=29729 RepID=A0A0B0P858_GOSAR|nr:hypothetical protein F383_29291 [Gossypium arboreum]
MCTPELVELSPSSLMGGLLSLSSCGHGTYMHAFRVFDYIPSVQQVIWRSIH